MPIIIGVRRSPILVVAVKWSGFFPPKAAIREEGSLLALATLIVK